MAKRCPSIQSLCKIAQCTAGAKQFASIHCFCAACPRFTATLLLNPLLALLCANQGLADAYRARALPLRRTASRVWSLHCARAAKSISAYPCGFRAKPSKAFALLGRAFHCHHTAGLSAAVAELVDTLRSPCYSPLYDSSALPNQALRFVAASSPGSSARVNAEANQSSS